MAFDPVRARATAIRLGKSGPARLRGPVGRTTRRFRAGFGGPLVTVVVPVSDDGTTRVGPCLDTLKVQTHRNLDIVVAPYGRHERVAAVVAPQAAADWRIRRLRPAADLIAARHAGIRAARGSLLIVAEAGDDFVPEGIEALVRSHQLTGSPLVVGRMRRPPTVGWIPDAPLDAAHVVDRRGTDLARSPVAVTDLALGNRLATRELWSSVRFTPGLPDGADVALALLRSADRFDLLAAETYVPTRRRDGVGVGSVVDVLSGLEDWLAQQGRLWDLVEAVGDDALSDWWRWGQLGYGVQRMIADVERADDRQWALLREHVGRLLETAGTRLWSSLGAEARVKTWLLRQGQREALEAFLAGRLFAEGSVRTVVEAGRVRAFLPLHDDTSLGLPDELFLMTDNETRLRVVLADVRWLAETIELTLLASPDFVDLPSTPEVEVSLVEEGVPAERARRFDLTVLDQPRDPRAHLGLVERREQDASRGAIVVEVPLPALVAASGAGRTWVVEVTLSIDGLTRTGPVTGVDARSSAGLLGRDHLAPRPCGDALVTLLPRTSSTGLRIAPDDAVRLHEPAVVGRTVRGRLRLGSSASADPGDRPVAVVAASGGLTVRAEVRGGEDRSFELTLPPARHEQRTWTLQVVDAAGRSRALGWPARAGEQWWGVAAGSVVLSRGAAGETRVIEAADEFVVDDVRVAGLEALVRGRWLGGTAPADAEVRLEGPKAVLVGEAVADPDPSAAPGAAAYRFRLAHDPWGLGERPVPPATYPITVHRGGRRRIVPFGEAALERLGAYTVDEVFASRLVQYGRDANLDLDRPLRDDERGPSAQCALQRWYAAADLPIEPDVVYLQSYLGASATDSQLALHEELRRSRPDLRLVWGVHDSSCWTPEGAERVQLFSREWYRVLATAGHLCLNIDPERWFRRREGQRVLQTFHGYPAKSMGLRMWRGKNFTPRRIDLELARTSGQWDLILTPAPEMDEHYRREYAYDGPIHSHGYPRDDVLVGPGADARRAEVRARLGIAEHQTAVLYAPTWRDDLATNWREAEMVQHLDLAAAARELGPDYVLLMRGHRFHSAAAARPGGETRYRDVTDYPEINDLILASDAAVLDYSSLRFDFALTMRPMIFLVPDLDSYVGGVRGFLYDYRDSAPGPLVDTADEAVALLKDLPGLRRRTAEQLEHFAATYNRLQTGDSARRVAEAFFGAGPAAAPEAPAEAPGQ